MIQTVLKRDGRVVGFNEEKIATAIRKAMLHTDKGEDLQLIHQITDRISFKGDSQMTVEAIQDLVEVELMKSSRKDVAQKYIAYRNQRSIARKAKTRDMFLEIINIKSNDITRENANMNADTPAGRGAPSGVHTSERRMPPKNSSPAQPRATSPFSRMAFTKAGLPKARPSPLRWPRV